MKFQGRSLRWVVLNNPYDSWNETFTQTLFSRMINLRLRGYGAEYPHGTLPMDTVDFVATHVLLCQEWGSELFPIMGFKTISLDRCKYHRVQLPALTIAIGSKASVHEKAVLSIIERCESSGRQLAYYGGWTIDPELRKDPSLSSELKRMLFGAFPLYHEDFPGEEAIGFGVNRFKVPSLFGFWGFKAMESGGELLPPISMPSMHDELVTLLHFDGSFTQEAKAIAEQYRSMWNERIEISRNSPTTLIKIAA